MTTVEATRSINDDLTPGVQRAVQMFLDRLIELRELDAVAEPAGDNPVSAIVDRSGIGPDQRNELYDVLEQLGRGLQTVADAAHDESGAPAAFSLDLEDEEVGEVLTRVVLEAVHHIRRREVSSHARTGALMLMVGALETLVATMATDLLRDSPARVSDKSITVGQLESLGSVDAARRFAIQRSVESLMHGGVAEWSKFFASFDVHWDQVASNWWEFREIDARRNIVAHADSTVNEIYLNLGRVAKGISVARGRVLSGVARCDL